MISPSVRVEGVGKAYRLGVTNRHALLQSWGRRLRGEKEKLFWALQGIDLEVKEGEVVGIMGHNGAGKSTLLKILSQITAPTCGRVKLRGRVASLLEVGTGFNMELTGRENVYLNGAILGMSRAEVNSKFDEIVALSEVPDFIDTPVKRYSSGMRVRLAFAVAAHLDPEILIIDEVLAVGDASFQQRSLGKIGDVARSGRTVLFVSHNAAAVESLCRRGVVLDHGKLVFDGTQTEAIAFYAGARKTSTVSLDGRTDRLGIGGVRVGKIEIRDAEGRARPFAHAGEEIELWFHFERETERDFPRLKFQVDVRTHLGAPVFQQSNALATGELGPLPKAGVFICRLPRLALTPATYHVDYKIKSQFRGGDLLDALPRALELEVQHGDFFGTGRVPKVQHGPCLMDGSWRIMPEPGI